MPGGGIPGREGRPGAGGGKTQKLQSPGFEPSYRYGITPGPDIHLPHPDCLMVKALEEGALEEGALAEIRGVVDYSFYDALQ